MPLPSGSLSVPLRTIKVPGEVGHLAYTLQELPSTRQARLAGRFAIRPEIDMKDFETRAVIDWLTVGVTFKRQTQIRFVQGEIAGFFERTPHIKDYEESSHHTSDRFKITVQEPDIASVVKALEAIDEKFGLRFEPSILGIEFSVDFTPHEPSDLLRAKMHRVLSSHLLTDRDILTNGLARPRTVWGTEFKVLQLVDSAGTAKQSTFVDGTTFFGQKGADVHWRVMDKIIDRQNARPEPTKHWGSTKSGRGSK